MKQFVLILTLSLWGFHASAEQLKCYLPSSQAMVSDVTYDFICDVQITASKTKVVSDCSLTRIGADPAVLPFEIIHQNSKIAFMMNRDEKIRAKFNKLDHSALIQLSSGQKLNCAKPIGGGGTSIGN